jgi:hypothetical protein
MRCRPGRSVESGRVAVVVVVVAEAGGVECVRACGSCGSVSVGRPSGSLGRSSGVLPSPTPLPVRAMWRPSGLLVRSKRATRPSGLLCLSKLTGAGAMSGAVCRLEKWLLLLLWLLLWSAPAGGSL